MVENPYQASQVRHPARLDEEPVVIEGRKYEPRPNFLGALIASLLVILASGLWIALLSSAGR